MSLCPGVLTYFTVLHNIQGRKSTLQTESNVVWYFENWTPQTVSHPIVIFVVTRLFIVTLLNQTTCEHPLRWNVPLKHNEKIKNVLFYTFPAISLRGIPAWFQRVHIRGWRVRLVLWLGGGGGRLGAGHHPAGGGGQLGRAPLARRVRGENWWGIELQASLCGDGKVIRDRWLVWLA